MRRLIPLLLLAASAPCWAASDLDAAPKQDACSYSRSSTAPAAADADSQQAQPATPTAARTTPKATATSGGGDAEIAEPRARNLRWHSFLPGMFR